MTLNLGPCKRCFQWGPQLQSPVLQLLSGGWKSVWFFSPAEPLKHSSPLLTSSQMGHLWSVLSPPPWISLHLYQQPLPVFAQLQCDHWSGRVSHPGQRFGRKGFAGSAHGVGHLRWAPSPVQRVQQFPSPQCVWLPVGSPKFGCTLRTMETNKLSEEGPPFTLERFHISDDFGFLLPNPLVGDQAGHADCGRRGKEWGRDLQPILGVELHLGA